MSTLNSYCKYLISTFKYFPNTHAKIKLVKKINFYISRNVVSRDLVFELIQEIMFLLVWEYKCKYTDINIMNLDDFVTFNRGEKIKKILN